MVNAAGEEGEQRRREERAEEAGDDIHAERKEGREVGERGDDRKGEEYGGEEGRRSMFLPREKLPYLGKLTVQS